MEFSVDGCFYEIVVGGGDVNTRIKLKLEDDDVTFILIRVRFRRSNSRKGGL